MVLTLCMICLLVFGGSFLTYLFLSVITAYIFQILLIIIGILLGILVITTKALTLLFLICCCWVLLLATMLS